MPKNGRLAQSWLERLLDMQEVTRSSRVPPILHSNPKFQNLSLKEVENISTIFEFWNFNIVCDLIFGAWSFNRASARLD